MSDSIFDAAAREIFTPSQLTRAARDLLESRFALIWLEGEISNFSKPASGHLYFTLKDASAQVRCAMFKPKSTFLRFRPADGMRVLARARVSLYEARGEFQLIVEHLEEAGEGALQREFERLKAKLAAEGLFEADRKRALPRWPQRIGVITSPTGAAVRDVLSVLRRRWPLVEVEILPVPVQGKDAAPAIVAAIQRASAWARHDVLLLTRGGGSLEDLWSFNDEVVARAIAATTIPVISAIGHEIDFTIADFVADLRAATPSAAAELLVNDVRAIDRELQQRRERLALLLRRTLERAQQRVDHAHARLNALRPQARLQLGRTRLAHLHERLQAGQHRRLERTQQSLGALRGRLAQRHPQRDLIAAGQRLQRGNGDLQRRVAHLLERRARHLAELARALNAVSPLATLSRGYAILFEADTGRVVRTVHQLKNGDGARAMLADGEVHLRVDNARSLDS
jgi:exodeoxyribonuclease VII large subunit